MYNNIITLENMRNMSIDEIVELYKDGHRLDEPYKPLLTTLQTTCSSGALIGAGIVGLGLGLFLGMRLCRKMVGQKTL